MTPADIERLRARLAHEHDASCYHTSADHCADHHRHDEQCTRALRCRLPDERISRAQALALLDSVERLTRERDMATLALAWAREALRMGENDGAPGDYARAAFHLVEGSNRERDEAVAREAALREAAQLVVDALRFDPDGTGPTRQTLTDARARYSAPRSRAWVGDGSHGRHTDDRALSLLRAVGWWAGVAVHQRRAIAPRGSVESGARCDAVPRGLCPRGQDNDDHRRGPREGATEARGEGGDVTTAKDRRELVESSFATVRIECSSCGGEAEIDVEFVVQSPGEHPYGHRFDLPEGWTINAPEGALCGVGLTCAECNGTPKKRKRNKP